MNALASPAELFGCALLLACGVVAGWINTLAGGGSLLTVPALMWFGLPADLANGTSRIAVLAQGLTASLGFLRAGKLDLRQLAPIAVPSVLGAGLGAYTATVLPNRVFTPILIGTLIVMAASMFLDPKRFAPPEGATPLDPRARPGALLTLFFAGFYGGFLQAGVGIVLLFVFARFLHIDLVRGNGLKVAVIFAYSILAVLVFAARAQVAWLAGVSLAVGQMLGALWGVRTSLRMSQATLQKVVFWIVVAMAVALLFRG